MCRRAHWLVSAPESEQLDPLFAREDFFFFADRERVVVPHGVWLHGVYVSFGEVGVDVLS